MAIDATVGGASSNSYVTLAEATAYFGERLYASAWDSATDADKEKALLQACRGLERCRLLVNRRPYGYPGEPQDSPTYDSLAPSNVGQALSLPRNKDRDSDGLYAIPQPVKNAQCEEALALLARGAEQERRRSLQAAGVTAFSVDGLSETYAAGGAHQVLESAEARALLAPYLRRGGVIATTDLPAGEWTPGSTP